MDVPRSEHKSLRDLMVKDIVEEQRKIIDSFTISSGYPFLSNFHPSTIYIEGKPYPTVEHAYQSHKTIEKESRELIRRAKSPADAKKLGRAVPLREDWDSVKISLMRDFIKKKFENPFLRHSLLSTGSSELIYGNTWNDKFWGVCKGIGQNWLGKILMEERDRIIKDSEELSNL
jgi:ribA/ribD-fused uncharacterized protein